MDLQYLCTNCLQGTLKNGVCTYCHKSVREVSKRTTLALPDRYLLGKQYYLGKVIGNGGFGITYLAWDCKEQRRVIVKELYPRQDVQRDPVTGMVSPVRGQEEYFQKCKQRFREEARLLYDFRQEPAIVDVYRLMEENNTVYYSMEFLTGFDLRTYLKSKGRLTWPELAGYARSLLCTLRIIHAKGLIHRDISPDNIFLITVSEAKLIDFGSVRAYNSGKGLTTILKHAYAPIEQYFTNGSQGPWTDIYSLSVTLYHALSGTRPPSAPDRAMKKRETTPLEALCPELPLHVARAVTRGMSVMAADRYGDVTSMARDMFPGEDPFAPPKAAVSPRRQTTEAPPFRLKAVSGIHCGRELELFAGASLTVGRDKSCGISYPPNSPGISRRQFTLKNDRNGGLLIQDEHSSYGTFVSGRRIEPERWYRVERGSIISFAGERYYVE